jgi:hypothetical protein
MAGIGVDFGGRSWVFSNRLGMAGRLRFGGLIEKEASLVTIFIV